MYANILLSLVSFFTLLLSLSACKLPKATPPIPVCYVTQATEQVTIDTPPTLTLQRSFTYANGQLTNISEQTDTRQATYRIDYQDNKVVQATGSPVTMAVEHDVRSGKITKATMMKGAQVQSVFTMTYTASGRLNTLSEDRQVLVAGSSVVGRTYSFSYTNAGNTSTEQVRFTFQNGATLDQETTYTVGENTAAYATFPEPGLLTVLSLGQQFENHPGQLWLTNALTAYQTYTISGTNRLLAESATFTNQFDATGNLIGRTQTTRYYTPAGSTFFSTKPTTHVFQYDCR